MKRCLSLAIYTCAFAMTIALAAPRAHAISFTVKDLGTLGGPNSIAFGINNSGQVVGRSDVNDGFGDYVAFVYKNGGMVDLGTLGGNLGEALGIDNAGNIVGGAHTGGDQAFDAFADYGGGLNDIIAQSGGGFGGTQSYAYGINTVGGQLEIVGGDTNGAGHYLAYKADVVNNSYILHFLGTLGGSSSDAYSINTSGVITGDAQLANGSYHAYSDSGGVMHDLGTLSGSSSAQSFGNAVNNTGTIVGQSDVAAGGYHAFLYSGAALQDIGTLGGNSRAEAINNNGQVVGGSVVGGNEHAFYYSGSGMILDLNTLITNSSDFQYLSLALGINDSGQIVGQGVTTGGQTHAFLLTENADPTSSVPEPATILTVAAGLAALLRKKLA